MQVSSKVSVDYTENKVRQHHMDVLPVANTKDQGCTVLGKTGSPTFIQQFPKVKTTP